MKFKLKLKIKKSKGKRKQNMKRIKEFHKNKKTIQKGNKTETQQF